MFTARNQLFTNPSGYPITRSVRLRSSATAYFNRTMTTPTNNKIWTWSGWVKRGSLGASNYTLFGAYDGTSTYSAFLLYSADTIGFQYGGASANTGSTTAVYRDPSAWYHVVWSVNATAGTSVVYVNGVQTGSASIANVASQINSAISNTIGRVNANYYLDGYLTEINFVDGQALTPLSFGLTNAVTGVWQPVKYTGTYGTNGYYLNFSDNSASTAATIGKDYSGNGNNWTPNNISVTAGTTYDSMLDVPTPYADGGNGRGNYAVLNPLNKLQSGTTTVISDGNLNITSTTAADYGFALSTMSASTKVYWESVITSSAAGNGSYIGASLATGTLAGANNCYYTMSGVIYLNAVSQGTFATIAVNDIIGNIYDPSTGTLTFYKNNTLILAVSTGWTGSDVFPFLGDASSNVVALTINFGQRPFTYTPPSGYVALNTQNLPTPTISNGANYMAANTYTGTGATLAISNAVNSISFQPDWVWVKGRSGATDHALYDSVRGTTKDLVSNSTAAETTQATGLTAFGSAGFTVGALAKMNTNAATYVGWQWKAGAGTTSNITVGQYSTGPNVPSIASTVSVGATQGFSVVTWAGNSTNAATIGHGLGVAPNLLITKSRTNASSWIVGIGNISGFGVNDYLILQVTNAKATSSTFYQAYGANTFTTGVSAADEMNKTGNNYVTYCFAPVAGYSAFGSYTGNGSTDGPFVFLGFRPRWVMVKRTDTAGNSWYLEDSSRNTYNPVNLELYADLSNAEATSTDYDFLSNGFKIRASHAGINASGGTYIYACFAENPFKLSLAR